tara:strand:- start:139 stop:561 length:423 start_codon:yes stop_codon:yes gene_type:complete
MREIKFRAWNPENKSMVEFDNEKAANDIYIAKHLLNLIANKHELGENLLMQFTGLQDKNGVDIYEGDVIKTYHFTSRANGKFEYINHIVKWSEKFHGWFLLNCESMDENDGSIQFFVHLRANKDFEITGNIHCNPQLLEK